MKTCYSKNYDSDYWNQSGSLRIKRRKKTTTMKSWSSVTSEKSGNSSSHPSLPAYCPSVPAPCPHLPSNGKNNRSSSTRPYCSTCGKKQSWLSKFKKCASCHQLVCKGCTIGGQNLIVCGMCQATRRSENLANWSFASGKTSHHNKVPPPTSRLNPKVQDYLEQLVAKHLGGAPPDPTKLNLQLSHPSKYDNFIETYHDRLTKVIQILGKALHLRPPDLEDENSYEQPATEPAHDHFAKLLLEVREAAMDFHDDANNTTDDQESVNLVKDEELKLNEKNTQNGTIPGLSPKEQEFVIYEEALSTAILNKVILDAGLGGSRKSLSPVISVVDSAVQTDNDGELSATGSGKYNVKSWVTTTTDGFSNFSDDDISLGTSSSNWSGGDGTTNVPVVHQIEEHVEITYETKETDSDTSHEEGEDDSSSPQPHQPRSRGTVPKKTKQLTPFPEHGVDIIDSPDELNEDEHSRKVTQVLAWEHNWLFKRKKKPMGFSSMARESVPMLVPNPSSNNDPGINENQNGEERQESSDIEDEDFNKDYFEFPDRVSEADGNYNLMSTVPDATFAQMKAPENLELSPGKTARFSVILPHAQFAPPLWRSLKTKRILKPQAKKIQIKENPPQYTLVIYDVQPSDAGEYQVLVQQSHQPTSTPLPHISRSFHLHVKASDPKKSVPEFVNYDNSVRVPDTMSPTAVHFKMSGHPEPVLNVFKGNEIITTIENKGDGQWTLLLDGHDKTSSIEGEYVAVATNEQGTTQAKFTISVTDETSKPSSSPIIFKEAEKIPVPRSVKSSQAENQNGRSSSSSSSEAEETMKETSQSLVTNDTLELHDDQRKVFTVAEREKMKWANPIKLEFNPYAPENLAKRIRAGRTSRDLVLGAATDLSDNEPVEDEFFKNGQKQATPEPNIMLVDRPNNFPSDLGGVKLPSVKELAQQFSPANDKNLSVNEHRKSITPTKEVARGIQRQSPKAPESSVNPPPAIEVQQIKTVPPSLQGDSSTSEDHQTLTSPGTDQRVVPKLENGDSASSTEPSSPLPTSPPQTPNKLVHSLTARSVSREFREGLRISKGYSNPPPNIMKLNNGKCNNNGIDKGETPTSSTNLTKQTIS